MGKNKKELDEMLSSDSECEKTKEKVKKKGKNVDEEVNDNDDVDIKVKPSEKEKKKKKNKEKKCTETKEDDEDVKESKKKKNKKDKVKKVSSSSSSSEDEEEDDDDNKMKDKKKVPLDDDDDSDDDDDVVPVKKKKQKQIEHKPVLSSSSSSDDIVIEKPKKTSKTKIDTNDNEDNDSEEDEEVKPKVKKPKHKNKTQKDDDDSENEDETSKKENTKDISNTTNNNNTQHEEAPQKHLQQKSYSSGTWPELFIKNLSYNTTDVGLAEFFAKYGDVEETKIVYDKQSGRSKGVGFCRFYDASSAVKAMEDAGKLTLDGRPIAISYSNERPSNTNTQPKFKADTSYQGERFGLFVGNLSFKSNEQGIKNLFEDCGKIIDIRIAKNEQGKMRGFAHVDFDSSESVDKALKKNGFKLDGRELKLDKSESKPARGNAATQGKTRNVKVDDVTKAKKSGAIIAPKENKVIQFDDSDDDE